MGLAVKKIKVMNELDLQFAYHLAYDIEKWTTTQSDFQRLIDFTPGGCFIAYSDDKKIGMVSTTIYDNVAWIGSLIVLPEYRGKGIGTNLMEQAIQFLEDSSIETIRLDAVFKAIPLYKKLGFEEEYESLRFISLGREMDTQKLKPMKESELAEVILLDKKYTGLNREKILRRVYSDFPDLNFLIRRDGSTLGFIMAKNLNSVIKIGPWICDPDYPHFADILIKNVINEINGKKIWVGIPAGNEQSVKILNKLGFSKIQSSMRMCRGKKPHEDVKGIFGIGSPEKS